MLQLRAHAQRKWEKAISGDTESTVNTVNTVDTVDTRH